MACTPPKVLNDRDVVLNERESLYQFQYKTDFEKSTVSILPSFCPILLSFFEKSFVVKKKRKKIFHK